MEYKLNVIMYSSDIKKLFRGFKKGKSFIGGVKVDGVAKTMDLYCLYSEDFSAYVHASSLPEEFSFGDETLSKSNLEIITNTSLHAIGKEELQPQLIVNDNNYHLTLPANTLQDAEVKDHTGHLLKKFDVYAKINKNKEEKYKAANN